MQFRGMRIIQSPCRTSTNKPVKITLKAIQLANAIIAGLKSDCNNGGLRRVPRAVDQKGHHRQI